MLPILITIATLGCMVSTIGSLMLARTNKVPAIIIIVTGNFIMGIAAILKGVL
jgi:hypothetical protein